MSITALRYGHTLDGLSLVERVVLAKLANHANESTLLAFVKVETIAKHAGISERHVTRTLTKLLQDGLIVVEGPHGRTGGRRPPTYRIVIPASFIEAAKDQQNRGKVVGKPVGKDANAGQMQTGEFCHPRGDSHVAPPATPESAVPVIQPGNLTKNPPPFGRPPRGGARKGAVLFEIDPNWQPDDAGRDFARKHGITDLAGAVERFRNTALAKGERMADWQALWRFTVGKRRLQPYSPGIEGAAEAWPAEDADDSDLSSWRH